jgi:hypothetical protein
MTLVLVAVSLLFGVFAVLSTIKGESVVAAIMVGAWALWLFVGARAQRSTPYRLKLSGTGLYAKSLLGTDEWPWAQVQRIRFLRSRWTPERIQQVEIVGTGNRRLMLFSRLSEFDSLVEQLRQLRPDVVEE